MVQRGSFALHLAGSFIQSILYGIYFVTFIACIVPTNDRPHRDVAPYKHPAWGFPRFILFVTVALFIIATVDVAFGPVRTLNRSGAGPGSENVPRDWLSVTSVRPQRYVVDVSVHVHVHSGCSCFGASTSCQ